MTLHEQIKSKIEKKIYEWVKKNFGESEADEPSWNIEALADELSRADFVHDIYCSINKEIKKGE